MSKIFNFSKKYNIIILCIFLIVVISTGRFSYAFNHGFTHQAYEDIRYSVIFRFDSIVFGVLAAYLFYYYPNFWYKNSNKMMILGLILFLIYYIPFDSLAFSSTFKLTLISITVFLFLPYFYYFKTGNKLLKNIITYISLTSYSLYLTNSLITDILQFIPNWEFITNYIRTNIIENHVWGIALTINYILFWVLSFFSSILLYKYFELPTMLYLRNKFNSNKNIN